jgi:Flp pilus assembly protein TadG
MRGPLRYVRDWRGNAAVEFALIVPFFFAMMFALLYTGLLVYAYVGLHYATEDAARCYAVNTQTCNNDAPTTVIYAGHRFKGPVSATFTANTNGNCHQTNNVPDGHQVTGSGSFTMNVVVHSFTVPLSTTACFP